MPGLRRQPPKQRRGPSICRESSLPIHPASTALRDAGTGGEVMFLDGLASTLGCPRSSLTVPLPRGRVVFYSRNNRTSDRIIESPTRRSLEPTVGLFDDLHCSDNGKWPLGWRMSRFRVEDKGPEKAEQPAMWEKGKSITEWNWRPGSPGSVASCPFAEAILAPVGAESINAQRRRDEFETRTASACPNASLHTAEWGGEANAFPRLSGTKDITSLWQSLDRRSTTHRLKWDKKPKRALFHPHLRVSPNQPLTTPRWMARLGRAQLPILAAFQKSSPRFGRCVSVFPLSSTTNC